MEGRRCPGGWATGPRSTGLGEPEEGPPQKAIRSLFFDQEDRLWIVTYGEGLYFLHRKRLYNISTDDGLGSREVYALEMDDQGADRDDRRSIQRSNWWKYWA